VDAIGGFRQIYPGRPHGSIGASRNGELFGICSLLEVNVGIVGVGGKDGHALDFMDSLWRGSA